MGSNDHEPTGSATLKPWSTRGPKEILHWSNVKADAILSLIGAASKVGAYIGFGSSSDQTALLLYVKHGRINERVALESYKEADSFAGWIVDHWLQP